VPERRSLAQHLADQGITLNPGQRRVADTLDTLYLKAEQHAGWSLRRSAPLGAYLWGEPGRGKTMLMDGLFALSALPAQRIHYHQFLRDLHRELAQAGSEQDDCLRALARKVATRCRMFCLDEFHMHDVADTILLERFLAALLEQRVLVVLTSNYAPPQLLPDPHLHRYALPVIALIESQMVVLHLDGQQDYRYRETAAREQYLHPCNEETDERLRQMLAAVGPQRQDGTTSITLSGRSLAPRALGVNWIWFDFDTICLGPRSHLDYLEMSERWEVVVLSDIRQAQLNKPDGLRRFIWLVDVLYDRRTCLLLASEQSIDTMLQDVAHSVDTDRTLSRLAEMRSASFAAATPIAAAPLYQ
jgi:cell division protein ZapE